MPPLRDIMTSDVFSTAPTTPVADAAKAMVKGRFGSALIMQGTMMLGIFTERDILKALSQDFDAPGQPVSHWMTTNPTTVGPGTEVDEALGLMLGGGYRHLPVTEGDKLLGMVSIRDLSRAATERTE